MNTPLRIAALVALGGLAPTTFAAGPAGAYSCASAVPGSLDRYDVVFVGSVTDVDTENRVLTVAVDEVWKGWSVPATVTMPAPEIGWGNWSGWRPLGKRLTYVFAPERTASGGFELPICRDWQADAEMLREHRPAALPVDEERADVRPVATPAPQAQPDAGSPGWLIGGISAAALLAGAATIAWRRRRTD